MRPAALALVIALAAPACQQTADEPTPVFTESPLQPQDAGDESFVKRAIPLMWGRNPSSAREIQVLVQVIDQLGREGLIRAMATAPDYLEWWGLWVRDSLTASRIGFYANPGCYGRGLQPEDLPDLAKHVRDESPESEYGADFTFYDLIRSALVLDDLTPIWTTNLVAELSRALDDQNYLAAYGQRRNRVQTFMRTYLNRRLMCMPCHNSEWAVTDAKDPELDRHWPVPGLFEKALLGRSDADDQEPMTTFFRRRGVVAGYYYAKEGVQDTLCPMGMCDDDHPLLPEDEADKILPWGWHEGCEHFFPADKVRPDDTPDCEPFWIVDRDKSASIWTLHESLRTGFEMLRDGLVVDDDLSVHGDLSFAWMVSANIVDQVWESAFGSRLNIINYFPRNQAQRDQLKTLTDGFVASGYSLIDLLVTITGHPLFNGASPNHGGDPHAYPAIFDPFVDDSIPVAQRRNHVGHTLHRAPARDMLRSAYQALWWPQTPEFLIYFMSPAARLQRGIGVFHKTADPGFDGVSFQSALGWEATVGMCRDQNIEQCYLQPIIDLPEGQISGTTICEICGNLEHITAWDPRCEFVDWDAVCTLDCGAAEKVFLQWFPKPEQPDGPDFISTLVQTAAEQGATLRQAVRTLKDRLTAQPTLNATDEEPLLEALLEAKLDSTVSAASEAGMRAVCGALVASPDFLVRGLPSTDLGTAAPEGLVTMPGQTENTVCEQLNSAVFAGKATCASGAITVPQ